MKYIVIIQYHFKTCIDLGPDVRVLHSWFSFALPEAWHSSRLQCLDFSCRLIPHCEADPVLSFSGDAQDTMFQMNILGCRKGWKKLQLVRIVMSHMLILVVLINF